MGSLNKNLKAYVRIDASGRVVAGSLVLRKNKPKVGRWNEIQTYECCNYEPTTTTSTSSTTTTTTTNGTTTTTTTPYPGTFYNAGYMNDGASVVCNNSGPFSVPLILNGDVCTNGSVSLAYGAWSDFGINNGATVYVNINNGNVIQLQAFGSSTMSFGCVSCGGTTTTTTTVFVRSENGFSGPGPQSACAAEGAPIMVYYTANNLDVGVTLYTDSGLTTPYNPNTFGQYIRLYFNAQYQVCTMNGSTIQSYTAC